MKKLQPYAKYKASGVEWLGEIPEHWNIIRLGFLGEFSASGIDKFTKKSESLVKIINFTDVYGNLNKIIDSSFNFMEVSTPEQNRQKHLVKEGDMIFLPSSETYTDLGLSALVNEDLNNTSFSYHVIRLVLKNNIQHSFRKYFTNNDYVLNQFARQGKGSTRKIIGRSVFKNINVIIPPLEEQTTIADFLDDKTTKIDQAISIKQQQIELLKERRQILIHKAVTQGINTDVKLKDSGVEWIGMIPEGWEVKRLKFNVKKTFSGGTPSTDKLLYWDGGIPWVSSVDVKIDYLSKTVREISLKGLQNSSSNLAPKGAVIFVTRSGILQHTFAVSILTKEMAINQDIKCIIFNNKVQPEYFLNLIKGNNSEILVEVRQQAATVESINMSSFYNLPIPIPPFSEQKEISIYIENATNKIATAISLKEQEIEKLKEYKSSLIDGVVTGKVRVF